MIPHGSWETRYRLLGEPFQESGSALVQGALDLIEGTEVAIKIAFTADCRQRFEREIIVGRAIKHPNVMPILDASFDDLWFTMPLASGPAFDAESPPLSTADLLAILDQVSQGIGAGHALGIVHRDLKPANILRILDRVVVADWGLARNHPGTTQSGKPTRTGLAYGTWGWSAPELDGTAHEATPAADIFSLGQIIGWIITGTEPRQNIPLIPVGSVWEPVVLACTQIEPADRPQSVEELSRLVALHVNPASRATLLQELRRLVEEDGARPIVDSVQLSRIGSHQVYVATLYPGIHGETYYQPDLEKYRRFLSEFPGSARTTFLGPPPRPVSKLSEAELLDLIEERKERAAAGLASGRIESVYSLRGFLDATGNEA